MKVCSQCSRDLPLESFTVDRWRKSGRASACRECSNTPGPRRREQGPRTPNDIAAARLAEGRKHCVTCQTLKPIEEFGKHRQKKDGLQSICRACGLEKMKLAREADPRWRDREWAKRHSLTLAQLDELFTIQDHRCAICRQPIAVGKQQVNIDHDHSCCPGQKSCGKCYRGLLCSPCNLGLGHYRDDPERLRSAADYLERTSSTR